METLFIVQGLHHSGENKSQKEKELHYWLPVSTPASNSECKKFIQVMEDADNGNKFYTSYRLKQYIS